MRQLGFTIGLDVGGLVSGAGRAAAALENLYKARDKAAEGGNQDFANDLDKDIRRLQGADSHAGIEALRGTARALEARIKEAEKGGDAVEAGKLRYARSQAEATADSLGKDMGNMLKDPRLLQIMEKKAGGQALTRGEEEHLARIDGLTGELRKNTEALLSASNEGGADDLLRHSSKVGGGAAEIRGIGAEDGLGPGAQGAMKGMMKGLGKLGLAAGAVSALAGKLGTWVAHQDRSGIVQQLGSGDARGAHLSEMRRDADRRSNWTNWIPIFGNMLRPLYDLRANRQATDNAKADLWDARADQSMELAAAFARPGGLINSNAVRGAFDAAADAAARFGFSAEDGMAAMRQAAEQGLSMARAEALARQVFEYERATGADRGALASVAAMSARFGAGDALGAGWAGLQASGMSGGQFGEYLRAMQRVMEDGISRGFVRSSEDVVKNLTMLSQLAGGDNPLWQGEHGARRLSEMNAGLEAATGLSSASDVMAFRAAMDVERDERRRRGESYDNVSWVYGMKRMERGLTPALLNRYMELSSAAEGGAMEGVVTRLMQTFGLNHINAHTIFRGWTPGMDGDSLQALVDSQGGLARVDSAEMEARRIEQGVANWWARHGRTYWDQQLPLLRQALGEAESYVPGTRAAPTPIDMSEMTHYEISGMSAREASRSFRDALSSGDEAEILRAGQHNALTQARDTPGISDSDRNSLMIDGGLRGMFSAGRDDRRARSGVSDTLYGALSSGGEQAAKAYAFLREAADILPETRRMWNETNKANSLAGAGDMAQMLALLRELINATKELGDMNVVVEDIP